MLRKRTRSKQTLMADSYGSSSLLQSPTQKQPKPTSFPKLLTAFSFKSFSETTTDTSSPTSILDTKPFSVFKNPFWSDKPETGRPKVDPRGGIGLSLAIDDESKKPGLSKPGSVLFGSQLRISSPKPGLGSEDSGRVFTKMELSEDYTCVICHGPNPKTIHIFDNCIVGVSDPKRENGSGYNPPESFLSYCYTCKKNLGHGSDIFMYRGEKAFCSSECRYEEMMLEEDMGVGKVDSDDVYGNRF